MTVKLRDDFSAPELRKFASRTKNANQSRRLLALAAVYDGMSRSEAARVGGMDRQTLRDWVHRFNAEGMDGLRDAKRKGAAFKLSEDQRRELSAIVEAGPDLERDGVVRWRRVDLQALIEERFGVVYAARSVSSLLHKLGFSHVSARPQHPAQDQEMLETYKKTLPRRSKPI